MDQVSSYQSREGFGGRFRGHAQRWDVWPHQPSAMTTVIISQALFDSPQTCQCMLISSIFLASF